MDIDSILIYIKSKSSLAIVCVDIKKSNKINSGSTYDASFVETHNCTLVPVEPGLLTLLVNRWFLVSSYLSIFCFLCTIFSTIDRLFFIFSFGHCIVMYVLLWFIFTLSLGTINQSLLLAFLKLTVIYCSISMLTFNLCSKRYMQYFDWCFR